jgi:3',5'-cyclic AMP phosphodiesterase CpdA
MLGRIMHLSDIHFGCENKGAVEAVSALAAAEAFDLIAISGDITMFGRPPEFEAAKAFVDALPHPTVVTPGNHDVPYATPGRLLWPFRRYRRCFGDPWHAQYDKPGLSVRAFNSSRGTQVRLNWSKGSVWPDQARQAGNALRAAPADALKVAVCHHPLMEVTGGPMTGRVRGGEMAVGILGRRGIDAILTGHVHTAFAHALPVAKGCTYAIGAATLSQRERGQPAGFNIIEWDEGCITVKAQGWTGSHFETIRTWALPRSVD